ncbi:hypothetical protein Tco_1520931, partial [Tanacetum coccineum]
MGEPLSHDHVFDFLMDKPEPQHPYDFFAPGPLPCYADNPNNMNGWIEADVPLLGELGEMSEPLGAEVDEPMVDPVIDKLAELIVEVEEQMVAPAMDMEEDLGDDDDSDDDDSEGPKGDEEVWEMDDKWLMAPVMPLPMPDMPLPSTYEVGGPSTAAGEGHSLTLLAPGVHVPPLVIEDLCTRMGNLEYGYGLLVRKVIMVSDAEVVNGLEQGQQAATQRDETIARLSQQVQTLQVTVQHRDVQIQQLQTLVAEMSSRE